MKMYCNVCYRYRKFKKSEISFFLKKKKKRLRLSIVYSKCGHEYKKICEEEESIEILKILGLIPNIEEYQEIYNHI